MLNKEEIIKLIEERRCKLLVKVIGDEKEFKVNVSIMDELTEPNYKIFVNPFLEYVKDLNEETLDFWTGKWYFDDLFTNMGNTRWTWEVME